MKFTYEKALVDESVIAQHVSQLESETAKIKEVSTDVTYANDRCSVSLPNDTTHKDCIQSVIRKFVQLKPKLLIVIGIGGSNLGTIAVQEALYGKLYDLTTNGLEVLYADTTDSNQITAILNIMRSVLQKGEQVVLNPISKSGGTTETLANFQVLLNELKQHREDYKQYVVVTTDEHSKLWKTADDNGYTILDIPKKVGGRYSVLSAVGLFPLGLMGINLDELLRGAREIQEYCLGGDNIAAKSAALVYEHSQKGIPNADMFLFSPDLESIGKWYRQLMGESIGKQFDLEGKEVFNGMTPTVSIGSTDLHSLAQLYLGGPKNTYTTFVHIEQEEKIAVPDTEFSSILPMIAHKTYPQIKHAILNGIQEAFSQGNRPFCSITLEQNSAYELGAFLQFHMLQMIYLAKLMNVNPFDQPNVEEYKLITKAILEK